MPDLDLLIAFAIADIAVSCPITNLDKLSSILSNLSFSLCKIVFTGMPVHLETISATMLSVTLFLSNSNSPALLLSEDLISFSISGIKPYCNSDIFAKSFFLLAFSKSCLALSNLLFKFLAPNTKFFSATQILSRDSYCFYFNFQLYYFSV